MKPGRPCAVSLEVGLRGEIMELEVVDGGGEF